MDEQDLHRAARDAQRHSAARVDTPTRYSDAVNRYLGVHDYVARTSRTERKHFEGRRLAVDAVIAGLALA